MVTTTAAVSYTLIVFFLQTLLKIRPLEAFVKKRLEIVSIAAVSNRCYKTAAKDLTFSGIWEKKPLKGSLAAFLATAAKDQFFCIGKSSGFSFRVAGVLCGCAN